MDTKEQGKPKRRAKRGVSGELATPDKKKMMRSLQILA
ncbi:choline binding A domain protein [Streptococcus pneumoniae GA41437]|nr:choline binding A domain protein [Streptococcus pneumoniae GA41410]EHE19043.1 choline binding A domain protein [Streptococcus pneumoniae GA41437]